MVIIQTWIILLFHVLPLKVFDLCQNILNAEKVVIRKWVNKCFVFFIMSRKVIHKGMKKLSYLPRSQLI